MDFSSIPVERQAIMASQMARSMMRSTGSPVFLNPSQWRVFEEAGVDMNSFASRSANTDIRTETIA